LGRDLLERPICRDVLLGLRIFYSVPPFAPLTAHGNMSPPLVPLLATRQLAVFTVFFGQLPPWLPLTLQSMAHNPGVTFIVIGDAAPPALLPPNVHFETVSYPAMQARLSRLLTPGNSSSVRYSFTYKANDIKPFAAHLYPELLGRHAWWAWADLDMLFGDLLKYLNLAFAKPACCKATALGLGSEG
jgi:hypothetical protein